MRQFILGQGNHFLGSLKLETDAPQNLKLHIKRILFAWYGIDFVGFWESNDAFNLNQLRR